MRPVCPHWCSSQPHLLSCESNCGLSNDLRKNRRHPELGSRDWWPWCCFLPLHRARLTDSLSQRLSINLLRHFYNSTIASSDHCCFPAFLSQGEQGDIGPRVSLVPCHWLESWKKVMMMSYFHELTLLNIYCEIPGLIRCIIIQYCLFLLVVFFNVCLFLWYDLY